MCDKVILENCGTLKFVSYSYKNQKTCKKAVNNYSHALAFVTNCYKTQKMGDKAINTSLSARKIVPECYKAQVLCHKAADTCHFVSDSVLIDIRLNKCVIKLCVKCVKKRLFILKNCLNNYKTQEYMIKLLNLSCKN